MGVFHTFSKYFLFSMFLRVQVQTSTGPPTSAIESQVLFTHLNEIHFDVTFERITSAWGSRKRSAHSFAIGWSPPHPTCPLVADATYDPELLSNPSSSLPLHTSLIPVLSCCQSTWWVCYSILLLLYHTVGSCWYITQMESVSKPGQIAFVDSAEHCCNGHLYSTVQPSSTLWWWVWFLPFLCSARLIFEGEFWNSL